MWHRFTPWWRALSVVLLSLAALTWPSAAQADTTPHFTVVHQNALTTLSTLGTTHFATTVHVTPAKGVTHADVSIYPAVTTRGALAPFLSGAGTTATALATTGTFALDCARHGNLTFDVTIETTHQGSPLRSCNGVEPRLDLTCAATGCDGVYPLRYTVTINDTTRSKWSLLSIRVKAPTIPLQVAYVQTLTTASLQNPLHSMSVLTSLGNYPNVPLTLSADYVTLASIDASLTEGTAWRTALDKAVASVQHRVIDAPPGDIDFAGLVTNKLTTQVPQQLSLSANLLHSLTGKFVDGAVLLSGPQSSASLSALAGAGVSDVVVPESDLAQAPSSTTTWGEPFTPSGVPGVTTLSADGPLSMFVTNNNVEPGRRAAMTLATLSFLDLENPNATTQRTVVIESPIAATSTAFDADLFKGLENDPLSELASLAPSFDTSLIGTNGSPTVRALAASSTTSSWSTRNVSSLLTLIGAVTSYSQGIKSGDEAYQLRAAIARSEITGQANPRQNAINAADNLLNSQLAQFTIDSSAVTLAGSGTSFPVTVISRAHYTVAAVVHLVTDRLSFPKGNTVGITMNSPTHSIRVPTAKARGSSLTLQVVLTTPNDQVVLARSAIQVRVAGASLIGYLLTFASLFVLGLWWLRTVRRNPKKRPKGRHAK
jgi:hypothetical protein